MADLDRVQQEIVIDVRTQGADKAEHDIDRVTASQGRLAKSTDATASTEERSTRQTRAKEESLARLQRQMDQALRQQQHMNAALSAYNQGVSASVAAEMRAANDRTSALAKVGSAFREAGKFAAEHPVIVAAGAAASTRALAGLAGAAATSLGSASAASARWAAENDNAARGVIAAANLAARGLGAAETAATVTAAGLGAASSKITSLTTATGLLSRGIGVVTPLLSALAIGFVAFEVGAAAIRKANADLDRLITLGKQAESLDVSAAFLAQFQNIGDRLGVEVDKIGAALQRASTFARDEFGKANPLPAQFGAYDAAGATGISQRVREQADLAKTTEERIRVALAAMGELEASGQHLAALDLSGKLFGPDVTERLRKGETSIAAMVADLSQVRGGDLVHQEDVARAVSLDREIESVKAEIGRALDVTVDFSRGSMALNEVWLSILRTVRDITPNIAGSIKSSDGATLAMIQRLQAQVEAIQNVSIPDALGKGQADRVAYLTEVTAGFRAEIDRLSGTMSSAADKIDSDVGRIAEPLRVTSDELQALLNAADAAARGLGGTAAAAATTGAALDNAAIKARGFADALNSIQAANPALAGTLSLMGKIGDVNRTVLEGTKAIRDEFQAGKISDGEAQSRITKLNDEAAASVKGLRAETEKPFTSYIREADIGKLDTLGQGLARAKDRFSEVRQQAEAYYQVQIDKASPEARGALEAERTKKLGELDAAYAQVNKTARDNAAEKGAKAAGKAADDAARDFETFRDKAADAFKAMDPAGALRKQGQELQAELDKYRDQLMRTNPEYVTALEYKIRLNLDGKDLESVKDKSLDIAREMSRTFAGVFDDMFQGGNKGLTGMLDGIAKGLSRMGTRVVGEAGGFNFNDNDETEQAA